jgi:hypothetical protein
VIPQTLGALIAFLTLVAPGIVFELLRERRRAGRTESVFREASRVALGSLSFSLVSTLLLLAAHGLIRWIFDGTLIADPTRLATDATYVAAHVPLIAWSIIAELVLACALAVALDLLLGRHTHETTSVRQQTAWHEVFRVDRPNGAVPWVHVRLTDGTSFYGFLRSHTASGHPDEREIVLEGDGLTYVGTPVTGGQSIEKVTIGDRWNRVIIPSTQISYLRVQYHDLATAHRVPPRPRSPVSAPARRKRRFKIG